MLYQADNGRYPFDGASGNCYTSISSPAAYIPGLAPTYVASLPPSPNTVDYYAYCWTANGGDYKVLRIVPGGVALPQFEVDDATAKGMLDPVRPTRSWGLWSPGCASSC